MNEKDSVSKSWFCVFNNPAEHGYTYESPDDLLEQLTLQWNTEDSRSSAMTYCISADGLHHVHMVLEDIKAMRFSKVKNIYPSAHIAGTKGTKSQAMDYINKVGSFEEKGEEVLAIKIVGEIKGNQGKRTDLKDIAEMIKDGLTPNEIFDIDIKYRRHEKLVKDTYYRKRVVETPFLRDVYVEWHVGGTGTGKSYIAKEIVDEQGEDAMYFINDYDNGCFDNYNGEDILFLDEFRGQLKYSTLLSILQGYKTQIHSRYSNIYSLWNRVVITSPLPPEEVYKKMITDNRLLDSVKQLLRRINKIVYHYKDGKEYKVFEQETVDYKNYDDLKYLAEGGQFVTLASLEKFQTQQMSIPKEWL